MTLDWTDDFNDANINTSIWTTNTPVGSINESGGTLNISISSGVNGNWYDGTNEYAPIIYTPFDSQCEEIIVKISSYSPASYKFVGLMLYKDRDNVWQFGEHSRNKVAIEKIVNNIGTGYGSIASATNTTIPLWLKIKILSGTYYFYYSTDGSNYTLLYSSSSLGFTPEYVGLFAKNFTSYPAINVSFDDFTVKYSDRISNVKSLITINEEDYVDWLWQNEVEITGSASGQLVNYPVLITVPYSSEFMRYDFGDIRFGTDYGLNLPYFLRQKVDGDFAEYFVKIPVIPANPEITTIYLYAGNEQAQDKSNGFDTFDLFDDFNEDYTKGIDTSKWTTSGTYPPTIVDGKLYINTGIPTLHSRLTSIATFGENYALGIKAKATQSGGHYSYVSFGFDDGSTRYIKQYVDEDVSSFNVNDAGSEDTGNDVDSTYNPSEYHVYEMVHKQGVNISENIDFTPVDSSIATISTAVPVKIHAYGYGYYQYAWVDYVYVRKAIANEPAIGEVGTWSTTQHSDIYKATLEIPFWEDYQALMCIRPLREDFQALLNITGYAEPEIQALINILPIIAQNYTGLYQASLEINADAGSKDVQSLINIGSVVDGSMEIYGKILYNYNKSAINTETSTGLSSDDSNVQFVINLGGRIYG